MSSASRRFYAGTSFTDRKLLADLSRCAWESLKVFLQEPVPESNPAPDAIIASQTFGDFIVFSPHCHVLVNNNRFYGSRGMFLVAPPRELKKLADIFRRKVIKMFLAKGKITREMIALLSNWGIPGSMSTHDRQEILFQRKCSARLKGENKLERRTFSLTHRTQLPYILY